MKKFLLFTTFLLIVISSIGKVNSIEADIFVQSTVNRASVALNSGLSKKEKIEKLKDIASETVDIKGIGLYTLGGYRKNIRNEQNYIRFQGVFA